MAIIVSVTRCYAKFTNAISVAKSKRSSTLLNEQQEEAKRPKRVGEFSGIIFPKICMICRSAGPKKVKGSRQKIKPIQTTTACNTLQLAAAQAKDDEMQLAITGVDLIAKEFQYHERCYQNYVRNVSKPERIETDDQLNLTSNPNSAEALHKFVQEHIIDGGQSVSIKLLTEMYGFDKEDSRLRNKVKQKMESRFGDQICFVQITYHEAEVVISKRTLSDTSLSSFVKGNNAFILKEAAAILRKDILTMIENAPELSWPPTVEDLNSEKRLPPETVNEFLLNLLHCNSHHVPGEEVKRYVSSFAQDMVHAVSRGKFMTAKHTLIGTALHSLTGQKLPIKVLARYGNSCNYETVQRVETAQAELVQHMRSRNYPLPLLPATPTSSVLTFFWWDNFDCKKESLAGSIHTCHGIAFQEESDQSKSREELAISIPSSGRKTVSVIPQKLPKKSIKPHTEPKKLPSELSKNDDFHFKRMLLLWKMLRVAHSSGNQLLPRFVGWVLQIYGKQNSSPTIMTFLPPILNPITEYSTVLECVYQSQQLSRASNMKYTHVTTDAGAAAKFYHVVWNNPEEFKTVIIHLGDFHALVEFFGVIGKIITGSGFEEIIYQAGHCTSGGLKGILTGKQYNRSWQIHECFAEAVDRLFCEAHVASNLDEFAATHNTDIQGGAIFQQESFVRYEAEYLEAKEKCLDGAYGKTPQFWMSYAKLVDRQHLLHTAINTNDFGGRLQCWKDSVSLCFSTNKQNYSRYGTYYCLQMESLEETHAGAKDELQVKGLSVCRNSFNIGQSIDGAGEQTFMKSSKTAGGIKNFTTQTSTYEKWVLSRPFLAQYVNSLKTSTGLDNASSNPRKCLRESEISKSEKRVRKIVEIMKEDFLNPFDPALDSDKLYNLASGSPVGDDIAENLLTVEERGCSMRDEFCKRLNVNVEEANSKLFFDPIKRALWKSFAETGRKEKLSANGKAKEIVVQRDVLGLLAAKSQQKKAPVNINAALCYPLAPVPLNLATCDGTRRKTTKSKLFDAALSSIEADNVDLKEMEQSKMCYILDLAAIIRSIVKTPDTFRELASKILQEIPNFYQLIYIACDTYQSESIKNAERVLRGNEDKFVIRSPDIRIPPDFKRFLKNGQNKERMFELMEQAWAESSSERDKRTLYVARGSSCRKIEKGVSMDVPELRTDHEEADTKIAYIINHAKREIGEGAVCLVRSSSGDIDIPVILLAMESNDVQIYIDNGTGKSRKMLDLSACKLSEKQRKALLGLHSFSGNDYVSSFLRRGKQLCWKNVKNSPQFLDLFSSLGESRNLTEDQMNALEYFVCSIFGKKNMHSVNEARQNIFWEKHEKDGKIVDLSLLPPCQSSLELHCKRANFVAKMWRDAYQPFMLCDDPQFHGWLPDMNVKWTEAAYPEDVADLLMDTDRYGIRDVEEEEDEEDASISLSDLDDSDNEEEVGEGN